MKEKKRKTEFVSPTLRGFKQRRVVLHYRNLPGSSELDIVAHVCHRLNRKLDELAVKEGCSVVSIDPKLQGETLTIILWGRPHLDLQTKTTVRK